MGRGGDRDSSDGDGVGMGTEAVGMGWGWVLCSRGRAGMGVQFLSPCRPLPITRFRCASKPGSISNACENLRGQHPLGAEIES